MKEKIYWVSVNTLPDDSSTVLVYHPTLNEPVWFGYHYDSHWYTCTGEPIDDGVVTHWAEMPEGPER